jgi:hypothetical protein
VYQNVVNGLYVERLFDFGVRRDEEMYQNEGWDEQVDEELELCHDVNRSSESVPAVPFLRAEIRDEGVGRGVEAMMSAGW